MACSFVVAMILLKSPLGGGGDLNWAYRILITVGITTCVWLAVTFLTPPVERQHLVRFYQKIKPGGLWQKIRSETPGVKSKTSIGTDIINWILGTILIYSALFGVGRIILLETAKGILFLLITAVSGILLVKNLSKSTDRSERGLSS